MTAPTTLIAPGTSFGNYRVERLLGRGGMGEVYLAHDETLRRLVALKVIHRPVDLESSATNVLLHEARNAAALNHPNICTIYEVGESNGLAFIAMEYVEGPTLSDRLASGALAIDEAIAIGLQAADALAEAHQRGVVHRDFKAANVIVGPCGRLKVVDFGLAGRSATMVSGGTTMSTIAQRGSIMGTPYAMAPEQVRGALTDARTDVWAFGVLLYEMVSGKKPFDAASAPEMYSAILRDQPPPLPKAVPVALQNVIARCLEKLPEARFRDAGEVRAALDTMRGRNALEQPSPIRRWHLVVATAVVALAALVLAVSSWRAQPPALTGPIAIAVLPFENTTGDQQLAALGQGLSQDMISVLSRSRSERLNVVGRAVSMSYDAAGKPLEQIGRELSANTILKGSLSRIGDRLRITAELLRTADGRTLWSDTYDRPAAELFPLGREICSVIVGTLGLQLSSAERTNAITPERMKPEAYDFYLRGLSHAFRTNERDLDQAIDLFEKAIAIEPSFVTAHAYLASAYGNKSAMFRANEPEWEEKGFAAAQRALAVDPESPEAHFARAVMMWRLSHGFPSREALAELRTAVAVQPNFDEAWHQIGVILFHVGHLDSGAIAIQKAIAINPANVTARFRFGPILVYQQRFAEAIAALDRVPRDAYPAQWMFQRAWALISLNRFDDADRVVEEGLRMTPDQGGVLHSARAMLRAKRGDRKGALADIAEAVRVGERFIHFHHTQYSIGAVYTELGDLDEAQRWIERAAIDGFPNYTYFETDIHLARLRAVPRFKAFLEQLRREWQDIPEIGR